MVTFLPTWTTPSGVVASAPNGAASRWLAFVWFLRLMGTYPWAVGSPGSLRIHRCESSTGFCWDTGNLPLDFGGLPEDARANEGTHRWNYTGGPEDADIRCDGCDARPSHRASEYPCRAAGDLMPRCWAEGTTVRNGLIVK
jgi:hypothetical protein